MWGDDWEPVGLVMGEPWGRGGKTDLTRIWSARGRTGIGWAKRLGEGAREGETGTRSCGGGQMRGEAEI